MKLNAAKQCKSSLNVANDKLSYRLIYDPIDRRYRIYTQVCWLTLVAFEFKSFTGSPVVQSGKKSNVAPLGTQKARCNANEHIARMIAMIAPISRINNNRTKHRDATIESTIQLRASFNGFLPDTATNGVKLAAVPSCSRKAALRSAAQRGARYAQVSRNENGVAWTGCRWSRFAVSFVIGRLRFGTVRRWRRRGAQARQRRMIVSTLDRNRVRCVALVIVESLEG